MLRPAPSERAILVGDLNVAPLEHDVWSHKQMLRVVSHTPIECEKLTAARKAGGWVDTMRELDAGAGQALHVVELPRAGLGDRRPRPPARSHLDFAALADRVAGIAIAKNYRGAARPSDHVPVTATTGGFRLRHCAPLGSLARANTVPRR